jgi:hypothetical protein
MKDGVSFFSRLKMSQFNQAWQVDQEGSRHIAQGAGDLRFEIIHIAPE